MSRQGARRFVRDVRALGALAEVIVPKQRRGRDWVEVGPGVFKRNPAQPAPVPPELARIVNGVRRFNQLLDQVDGIQRAKDEIERRARFLDERREAKRARNSR